MEKKKKIHIQMAGRDTFQGAGNFVDDRESLIRHDSQELKEQVRAVTINNSTEWSTIQGVIGRVI